MNWFFSHLNIFRRTKKELKSKTDELKKFRLALDQVPAAIYIINKDMVFEYANPEFTRQSGYTQEDVLHKHVVNSIYKGEIPENRREIVAALAKGITWQGELHSRHKSGRMYWANTLASPYNDDSGNVDGYIIIQQDITEQKRMAEALKESEDLYRKLIENSLEGMALSQDGKMLYINQTFSEMIGYTLQELMDMDPQYIIAPEDRERVMNFHQARMKGEKGNYTYTTDFIRKDGTRFTAEMNSARVQINGKNASLVTLRDITERQLLQKALEQSMQRYRDLAEMLPQTVFELDLVGNFTYLNQEGKSKFEIETLDNRISVYSLIVPEEHERLRQNLQESVPQHVSPRGNSYTAKKTSGENFPVLIFSSPLISDGKLVGIRGIMIDITEQINTQKALSESEAKYKALVEHSQNGISIVRENKFLFVNQTICNMLGYTAEELYEMPAMLTIHPDDRFQAKEQAQRRLSLDFSALHAVYRMITKTGEIRECETISTLVEFGGIWASFFTLQDVTETKKMQSALVESERKYRELAELLPQTVYEHDLNGNLTYLNQAGKVAFGIESLNPAVSVYSLVHADDIRRMKNNMTQNNPGESQKPNIYLANRMNGEKFPVMIFASPMLVNDSKVGTRGIVLDMTEHIAMQKAMQESEEKYRSLIENATDGILITQDGVFKFVNPAFCEMMQYSEDELLNMPFINVVDKSHHSEMLENHKRRMNGETFPAIYRARLYRKDGSHIIVELNSRTTDFGGNPASFVITRDITDRLQTEEELVEAKTQLEILNKNLEERVNESTHKLTEARTQLINLQKENLQSQFEVLRQQVNPHFLFNSLNVLTSLIKLEPDLAEQFSEHLSKVYRYVLENKDNELVDLSTELRFLDAYIFLLNIRFIDKIKVNINIPEEKRTSKIIPLAMQLLIENAIKHNIMTKTNPLIIEIFIDSEHYLNIVNNLQERPTQLISTGVGLKNIQNRYLLLNQTEPIFEKTNSHFIARVPLVNYHQ